MCAIELKERILSLITSGQPRLPKYRRIVEGVLGAVSEQFLKRGDVLPSVSLLCRECSLSRETVLKAYGQLKELGVIEAVPRKGYYVASETYRPMPRVFLLFDELSPYKQTLYNAFMKEIDGRAIVDIYFHHCNVDVFKMLVLDHLGRYGSYVIMPFDDPKIQPILSKVDPDKLLIFDRVEHVPDGCLRIGQEFNRAVAECLNSIREHIKKYQSFELIFPLPSNHPREIMTGFKQFCQQNDIPFSIVHDLAEETIQKGNVYFVLDDLDLVQIVERSKGKGYRLGQDVGVLSYNDTPMKRVIDQGITVISTDFEQMGRQAARFMFTHENMQQQIPTQLIRRHSL